VRLLDGRPGADRIERHDEGERDAGQVVAASGAREGDLLSIEAGALDRFAHDRHEDLDLVAVALLAHRPRLREPDDRDVTHGSAPRRFALRSASHSFASEVVLVGFVSRVGLARRLEVFDCCEVRLPFVGFLPHGSHAHAHAHVYGRNFLDQREERMSAPSSRIEAQT
jgi:hypothetical protein